jgi:hypothetical protein
LEQRPPHITSGSEQVNPVMQRPFRQVPAQKCPQPPQLAGSFQTLVSQSPPMKQSCQPGSQRKGTQDPPLHEASRTCPVAQRTPQPPQLSASKLVFTQLPPHAVAPVHAPTHIPPEHTMPEPQDRQQPLQCAPLLRRLVSQPLDGLPSQSPQFPAQLVSVQRPATQEPMPWASGGQTTPHPPQLDGSVARLVQDP